jgi:hypothetical protein
VRYACFLLYGQGWTGERRIESGYTNYGVFIMGRFADKAKKIRQENEGNFRPLELNEINVSAIFNRCLPNTGDSRLSSDLFPTLLGYPEKDSIILGFDKSTILKNKTEIQYLFGQLNSVHNQKNILTIEDFFDNYLNKKWTSEKPAILELLYLGNCREIDLINPFNAHKKNTTRFIEQIKPTLSPKDPNFEAWWAEHKSEWEDENPS